MTRIINKKDNQYNPTTSQITRSNHSQIKNLSKHRTMQSDHTNEVGTQLRNYENSYPFKSHKSPPIKPKYTKLNPIHNRSSLSKQDKSDKVSHIPHEPIEAADYMAAWCFDVLISTIKKSKITPPPPSKLLGLSKANIECPIFVTWLKNKSQSKNTSSSRKSDNDDLRGCIGCLSPIPILQIKEYAILSGLKDHRFRPISLDEVDSLTCKLSFLNLFELCDHIYDWVIGTHGIIINFESPSGRKHSSTFLPEVALENNMSHKTAIDKLIRKSDYNGPITDDLLRKIQVTRYQSSIVSLPYDQYHSQFKTQVEA